MSYTEDKIQSLLEKDRLTRGEVRYLDSRNALRLAREQRQQELEFGEEYDDDEYADGQDDEEYTQSDREYAENLTERQIKQIFDEREIEYPDNAKKSELVEMLVARMSSNEGEEPSEQ